MEILYLFIGIIAVLLLITLITLLFPLNDNQIRSLSSKRRSKEIRKYFSFAHMDYPVDNEFKKNMNPKGKLYSFSEDLYGFPSTAAGLLKYKKHEWIIISFEKDKVISKVWANKGADRNGVSSCLTISEMIEIASRSGHTSILIFHNHPNPQPNHLDTSQASPQDILSAQEYAVALNKNDINLLEFVCERGNYHQYCISVAGTFLPVNIFMDKIIASNGTTRLKNLTLHVERIFF